MFSRVPPKSLKSSFPLRFKARRAEGGLGGEFRPPYKSVRLRSGQVLGEISSNFFERTPPVRKCLCCLALCEGSPNRPALPKPWQGRVLSANWNFLSLPCRQAGLPRYCGAGQKFTRLWRAGLPHF